MVKKFLAVALVGMFLCSGCGMSMPQTKSGKGALLGTGLGAAIGAGLGQAIGGNSESTLVGAGIGAAVGGGSGYAWGRYLDKQEAELRAQLAQSEAVRIRREADLLALTFKSDMMFESGSYAIAPGAHQEIVRVSKVLTQYPDTAIRVVGHTDSVGSESANQILSEKRADSVKALLIGQGVSPSRLLTMGYGESRPVAENNTDAGRQANRRVEITIAQPETMKNQS